MILINGGIIEVWKVTQLFVAQGIRTFSLFGVPSGLADPRFGVRCKKLTASDAMTLYIAINRNRENIGQFFSTFSELTEFTPARALEYCTRLENETWRENFLFFTSNGEVVGQGSLLPIGGRDDHAQVSLWVDKSLQGKGFGPLIVQTLEKLAFDDAHDFNVLFYTHDQANTRSQRVAEKLGFEPHCEYDSDPTTELESGHHLCWAKTNPKRILEWLRDQNENNSDS